MRKKLLIIGLVLSAVFCGKMGAQLPVESTERNPIWYYIQVIGSSTTTDRVATAVGDHVEGLAMSIDNIEEMNRQMWRFERIIDMPIEGGLASGFAIINKATGKKLAVTYDPEKNLRMATLSDEISMLWRFLTPGGGSGPNIRMAFELSEGATGDINLYQTAASNSYALILTGSANGATTNAQFRFLLNNNPVISSGDEVVWMYVKNVKTGKYLTDAVSSAQDGIFFSLEEMKTGDDETAQQWKLVPKTGGRANFVNRATGNVVHTNTVFDRSYYFLQYADDPEAGDGWYVNSIGSGQFAVSTISPEGVVKYWHATTPDEPATEYMDGYTLNSLYAWTFTWVSDDDEPSGIAPPSLWEENIRIYAFDKRIYVEGCDDYRITTLFGTSVARNGDLPSGIYLVTVKGKTTKIVVK